SDPTLSEIETELFGPKRRTQTPQTNLVLLHPDGKRLPSGTDAWFRKRRIQYHHHLRWNSNEDFERLARFIDDRSIGIVFGGGGARGFAHIGVIRALKEAGIPIDMLGGTSIGALIAAGRAMGMDYERILETFQEKITELSPHKEYTLPVVSLFRSKKFDKAIAEFFHDIRIEDLWLNYFCVSSNLSTAETIVHRKGFLGKAVRASASIPGIFVPVIENNHLLADGAIVNNLPGDIMKEHCKG
ncbi:MAG: patatin-like phospholipase family protein, partial [Proteobacteria bacterium]|nr:patatin-like phospholipase family protein [Pseudomonadota bacterium]